MVPYIVGPAVNSKTVLEDYTQLQKWMFQIPNLDYKIFNRKYLRNVIWISPNFFDGDFEMEDLGYGKAKLTLLRNTYFSEDLMDESLTKLEKDMNSKSGNWATAFSFVTGKKSKRLKSYCMLSAVLRRDPTGTDLQIFYRTTEITRKFGADIVFLRKLLTGWVPKEVIAEIKQVTFYFNTVYVGAMYYPLAWLFGIKVPGDTEDWFFNICKKELDKAKDLNYHSTFSQKEQVYKFFRSQL